MVPVCSVPARGGRSCERFGGYKTINRIPLYCVPSMTTCNQEVTKEIFRDCVVF